MKFYLAPLEGITRFSYRNAVNKYFGKGVDKYFTPFFAPHTKRTMNMKEMQDVLPENNLGINLVPQILTNSAEDFLRFERDMREMFGYDEVNINLGCPSGTVVPKKRGAGFLGDVDELDRFLYEVFEKKAGRVSVKTRLGLRDAEEFYEILEVYNKYPMSELIVHPRVREEFYKGRPHYDMFAYALNNSKNELSYSGDINTPEDYNELLRLCEAAGNGDRLTSVMLGRGMVGNPALIRMLSGQGEEMNREELKGFHDTLLMELKEVLPGERPVLFKMKEIWLYLSKNYEDGERILKRIQKSKNMAEYEAAARMAIGAWPILSGK